MNTLCARTRRWERVDIEDTGLFFLRLSLNFGFDTKTTEERLEFLGQ